MKCYTMNSMESQKLINYLKGTGTDSKGRTIQDVWNFTDEQLEETHNYIQWLFPLKEMSENVMGSPFLDDEDIIKIIKEDLDIQDNFLKSLMCMHNFYKDNDFWLQPNDHNHLRITRILKSTTLLSSKENAKEFYEFIIKRVKEFRPVTEESLEYWKSAIY